MEATELSTQSIGERLMAVRNALRDRALLVAVSKTKPVEAIMEAYACGQRDFGENYVQELVEKAPQLPSDIRWHFIGHLQSNKVKMIAPIVHCIHAVDSVKLLYEIEKQAAKCERTIACLLQVHIAREESKFGFSPEELPAAINALDLSTLQHARVSGLMGMATFTDDTAVIASEFERLHQLFVALQQGSMVNNSHFKALSIGMSSDWQLALQHGSTMVRIGSSIFGHR
jgi:PLP dependent protein